MPIHKPSKGVSEERMREILERRSGKPFSLPPLSTKPLPLKSKSPGLREWEQEQWLIARLGTHGEAVDLGVTDRDIRRERMREAIHKVGPLVVIGRNKEGKTLTYAEAWSRLYGMDFV